MGELDAQAVADQGLFEIAALPATAAPPARATTPTASRFEGSRDRDNRERRPDRPEGGSGFGNGKKRDKKRSKKFRSEPQQPPQ